ncbi:MAG: hemerythrin domain-containing protein [Gammaproteobacteria bacterium]|jgi:regulator of cell morphogenesis and NO signaling|nr:hemerythrin domain-containing protein [Gammaproteobacteria bacterium]MDP6616233.1 hemerythrin domain-containing protein [Gammaproteobacteria bacterium]MDP6695999.1 hemerythrin domain-containing protein [Gammaproteobacteria bacterium]
MFELNSETKIAELDAENPAMIRVLKSTGMYSEGDNTDRTIDELCMGFGLNPMIILNMLARVQGERPPDIDISELNELNLAQIVEHIESEHHAFLRETLPVAVELVGRVAGKNGTGDDRLSELRELFTGLADELENHMLHEEEALFPMCRDMAADDGTIKPTRCGDTVGGPIACMENDHIAAKQTLARLGELTDNFAVPESADNTYREMIECLTNIVQNTVIHIYKEDHLLFPRALETQAALREGS